MGPKVAKRAIEKHGMLLVYPIAGASEPPSLWSVAYPRVKMRWEWDDDGDDRVARLWHLREELSTSGEVVYAKWFRGRATFFSRDIFRALLATFLQYAEALPPLSRDARTLLEALEDNSPLSTKQLKRAAGLEGRLNEPAYTRGMKELWTRLLIVAFGEVDEGAFPSLAIGATRLLFEDLYREAEALTAAETDEVLAPFFASSPLAEKFLQKQLKALGGESTSVYALARRARHSESV